MKRFIALMACTIGITHARMEFPTKISQLSEQAVKRIRTDLQKNLRTLKNLNFKALTKTGIKNFKVVLTEFKHDVASLSKHSHLTALLNTAGIGHAVKNLPSPPAKKMFLQIANDLHAAGTALNAHILNSIKTYSSPPFKLSPSEIKAFVTHSLNPDTAKTLIKEGLSPAAIHTLLKKSINIEAIKKLMLAPHHANKKLFNEMINIFPKNFSEISAISAIRSKLLSLSDLTGPGDGIVSHGTELSHEESIFRTQRLAKVRERLHAMQITGCDDLKRFSIDADKGKTPVIAVCASGGGPRAMIGALGGYKGLKETGILDLVTYMSVLSGGSWGTLPWVFSDSGNPLDQLAAVGPSMVKSNDPTQISPNNPVFTQPMLKEMAEYFAHKLIVREFITIVDIYGYLLAKVVLPQFGDLKYSTLMGEKAHELFATGDRPLPIGTAIIGREPSQATDTFLWLEITPFTVGSHDLESYIPTRSFGERFLNGFSQQKGPAPTLNNWLGIMGSAFAVNLDWFKREGTGNQFIDMLISREVITDLRIGKHRIGARRPLATWVNNFTFGDPYLPQDHVSYEHEKKLILADAGLDYNLPLPPLIERTGREVDMIIIFDSSAPTNKPLSATKGQPPGELVKAINYFKKKGIDFPPAELDDLKDFSEHKVSVLKSNKLTIMYVPILCNFPDTPPELVCGTFNFIYTPHQVEQLSNVARNLIVDNKCLFYNEIQDIITRK